MCWVAPRSVVALLEWWKGMNYRKAKKTVWDVIPFAILWSVWLCRNDAVFSGVLPSWGELVDLVKWRVAFWAKQGKGIQHLSIADMVYCDHNLVNRL